MAKIYHDEDADLGLILAKRVAIIGYGSQGHAHALNLRDSGVEVRVGLPVESQSRAKAKAAGLVVMTPSEAAAWADVVMILVPDTTQPELYKREIAPHLTPGQTLMFAHGFNIRFGTIQPPTNNDVSMIAPKSPGTAFGRSTSRVAELLRCSQSTRTRVEEQSNLRCLMPTDWDARGQV